MAKGSARALNCFRNSASPNGRDSARISWRMKKRLLPWSEWWLASMIQPPCPAMKPLTAATMPTRSGQEMERV